MTLEIQGERVRLHLRRNAISIVDISRIRQIGEESEFRTRSRSITTINSSNSEGAIRRFSSSSINSLSSH